MKNLGVLFGLIVLSSAVFGEAKTQKSERAEYTLALNDAVLMQPVIEISLKDFEQDQTTALKNINQLLEQKVEQKLGALLATQLETLGQRQ